MPTNPRPPQARVVSANLFDDLHELVQAVPVVPGEIDELLRSLDDGATLGSPGDRDATPAPEFEQPLVAKQS